MSYSQTISLLHPQADFTARYFIVTAKVVLTTGTYPFNGVGPLALAALAGINTNSATPDFCIAVSVTSSVTGGSPAVAQPSGYQYLYDPTTDSLRAYVQGSSAGNPLVEIANNSATINADTIIVKAWFPRGQ